jgi:peptidoglycan hydrolase CwlO-like protein
MKKKVFFVAAAIAVLSLSSCKKDYVCDCEVSALGITVPGSSVNINDARENDAQQECDDLEDELSSSQASVSCTLSEK